MKIIVSALLLTAFTAGNVRADVFDSLSSADKDKYVHFCAGTVISHGSYPLFKKYLKRKERAWLYALGLSVAAGAAKEINDSRTSVFSGSDLLYSAFGGVTIVVVKF